jgi:hypothetical protein
VIAPPRTLSRLCALALLSVYSAIGACGQEVVLGVEPDAGDGGAQGPLRPHLCFDKACGAGCVMPECRDPAAECALEERKAACNASGFCAVLDQPICGPGDECAGKPCGAPCSPCPPDLPECPAKNQFVCDRFGACVYGVTSCPCEGCPFPPYVACAGSECGDPCRVCPPNDPSCIEPAGGRVCGMDGLCRPLAEVTCPAPDCAGKPCGTPCGPCDASQPGCPPFQGGPRCDLSGACRFQPVSCYDPCAGKACGAPCTLCAPNDPACVQASGPRACSELGQCLYKPVCPAP